MIIMVEYLIFIIIILKLMLSMISDYPKNWFMIGSQYNIFY